MLGPAKEFFLTNKHVVVMVKDEHSDSKEECRLKVCVWCAHQTSVFLGK